jgi:hypothetical protein
MSAAKKVFWTQYFGEYAAASLSGQPETVAAFYATAFIAAAPKGSQVFQNDPAFLDWLRGVQTGNQAAGMAGLEVVGIEESRISDDYTMITVEWGARFHKTGYQLITFRIAYILELHGQRPQILAYISHEDQDEVMKREGLL